MKFKVVGPLAYQNRWRELESEREREKDSITIKCFEGSGTCPSYTSHRCRYSKLLDALKMVVL